MDIASLPFVRGRLELASPNGFQLGPKSRDRTVLVIQKWMAEGAALREARAETMSCLEARPATKGNGVSFEVMDRPKFDSLQEEIKVHNEALAGLETAIKALDKMGDIWFADLADQVNQLARTEGQETRQIANMSAGYIQRRANSGKLPEDILKADPEFQRLKNLCEARIKTANEKLATLRPRLEEIQSILEAVGV
jgi:hypothetical protein